MRASRVGLRALVTAIVPLVTVLALSGQATVAPPTIVPPVLAAPVGWQVVEQHASAVVTPGNPMTNNVTGTAVCPAGKKAFGGGYSMSATGDYSPSVVINGLVGAGPGRQDDRWQVLVRDMGGASNVTLGLTIYVICGNP